MAAKNPSVSITKSIPVFPSLFLEPQKTLILSNLDRQCPTLMYTVFFYGSSRQQGLCFDDDAVFSRLKSSLEATLSAWYPAAGRLILSRDDGKLNLRCNNGGAVLVQAVARARISELGDLSVYNNFFENLVFKPVIADGNITEMPLVTAQVTRFECGGYSIGIGTSHSLFDGISAFDFLRAWASQTHDQPRHQLHKPVHERGSLLQLLDNHSNANTIPTAIDHLFQLITQINVNQNNHEAAHDNLAFKTFHLSPAMIDSLKKKVLMEKKEKLCFSTFEVLAAHLWKARTRALGLAKDRKVCLQFSVDARNKTVPPLPKDFTGNAYVLASIVSTAGELEQHSYQHIINQIKQTKNSVTPNYIGSYIKCLQGPQPTNLPPLPELTVVSNWTRVPFHKVDFFGKEAVYASPLGPPIPQVAYFMQNPNQPLAVDVRIGLLPRIQSVFSRYFMEII